MEFVFPKTPVPPDFAGDDEAGPEAFMRLYQFSGSYEILFGDDFRYRNDRFVVVAAAESFGFLRRLLRDEDTHALSIFEPIVFGRRSGSLLHIMKYIGFVDRNESLIEAPSTAFASQMADSLEIYITEMLLKYYPNASRYILERIVRTDPARWET